MEEIVPVENERRKKFEKTVKGIKKMLKKGKDKPAKKIEGFVKETSSNTPITRDRGVVYIGHIPHGFYEDQMQSYFKQFGKVTNVRVARSKKNGKSKGYAFVEFQNKEVAEIVAQTMNNYLMDKRLLKAEYIPPDRQRSTFFSGEKWIAGKKCPGIDNRNKEIRKHNRKIAEKDWIDDAKKQLKRLYIMKAKLRAMGIDYDFFQPCDVPKQLRDYDPTKPNQPTGQKKKMNPDTPKTEKTAEDDEANTSVSNKKRKRKEKSMNKPVSPAVKPPKKKKVAEKGQVGQFVRPLLTQKLDEVSEKKSKKKAAKIQEDEVVPSKVTSKPSEANEAGVAVLKKKNKKKKKQQNGV